MTQEGGLMLPGNSATHLAPASKPVPPEPIAIVGMACRFPGVPGLDEFWQPLRDGRDEITEIPADRFDVEAFYDSRPGTPGKTRSRWGGLIQDVEGFDTAFFGISPREAVNVDPQQRLLMEVAWEAMEDAGEVPEQLAGSDTGVFIGGSSNDYEQLVGGDASQIDSIYMITGNARSISAGRLSYLLDLRGPSLTLDTACASSLDAVHLACQSIWAGESTRAFAGGINLILAPHGTVGFCQAGMAAADGRCKAFATSGDGFVRSDGIGVVLLKPLSQALADRNPVYATVLGSGAGNDGQTPGRLMTPGQAGQERVSGAACQQAGLDPRLVQYVEAYGTGAVVGDPAEVVALAAVLGKDRDPARPCLLGSVKSNIGHTEAAAGIARLIKTGLSLHHRAIPASLHAAELNPAIDWDEIPFRAQRELAPWPAAERALAGVSSSGMSGTNVHVVLEEMPGRPGSTPANPPGRAMLLPLSARSPHALRARAAIYADFLAVADRAGQEFENTCYTASVCRTDHEHRTAVVARSALEAAEQLAACGKNETSAAWRAADASDR
jgi:acyl transferase domain-containing protein